MVLAVAPRTVTLNAIGFAAPLTLTLTNARAADSAAVTWTSLDSAVAAVTPAGRVIARGVGTTRVVVTSGLKSDTAWVTVRQVPAAIAGAPRADTLFAGDTLRLPSTVVDSAGTPVPGETVTWLATAGLTVSTDGLVSAVTPGDATLRGRARTAGIDLAPVVAIHVAGPFIRLSAGVLHTCAVTSSGAAYCWGGNSTGAAGAPLTESVVARPAGIAGQHAFSRVAAGPRASCGLDGSGQVWCWGTVGNAALGPEPKLLASGTRVFSSLAVGATRVCAVDAERALVCWPGTATFRTTPPSPVTVGAAVREVFGTTDLMCVTDDAGRVYCLDDPRWVQALAPMRHVGAYYATSDERCGQADDGSLFCWRREVAPVTRDAGAYEPGTFTLAFMNGCVVRRGGQAQCWGGNTYGVVGAGTYAFEYVERAAARAVQGGLTFAAVAAGGQFYSEMHTCGISGGNLYCWGNNQFGQLGSQTGAIRCTPPPGNGDVLPCSPRPIRVTRSASLVVTSRP